MKRLSSLLSLILFISLQGCGEKEICYQCTKTSGEKTLTTNNCGEKQQVRVWRDVAEDSGYKCKEVK